MFVICFMVYLSLTVSATRPISLKARSGALLTVMSLYSGIFVMVVESLPELTTMVIYADLQGLGDVEDLAKQ